jgi:hypothetical protein
VVSVLVSLLHSLRFLVRSRASLHIEVLALRHQLAVVNRSRRRRARFTNADRLLWAGISRAWRSWRSALVLVKPETVVAWHRRGFRLYWTWKSRRRTGRHGVPPDVRTLIRELSTANPLWGAPGLGGNSGGPVYFEFSARFFGNEIHLDQIYRYIAGIMTTGSSALQIAGVVPSRYILETIAVLPPK